MDNNIELREINKLIKESFYIPTYQRGYRWDSQQVIDLLEDVYEFMGKGNVQNGEFYCLQPIVVKKMDDGRYEVIDGQQRLTTIMIIQKYLKKRTYKIEYASRPDSAIFLDEIGQNALDDGKRSRHKNVDYYFMTNAFDTIKKWFERKEEEKEEYSLMDEFNTYLLKYCDVIWYEINNGVEAESIFTRLNIGKIPLTNAELIKALFLRRSNYASGGEIAKLRQLEMASEWDSIENSLQDEKMWYFINPHYASALDTRIEYIFDVIAGKTPKDGENYTFIYYSNQIEENKIEDIWKIIKDYYRILNEWYCDQDLYHLIGFLTSSKSDVSIADLIRDYFENEFKKDEFVDYIVQIIRQYFAGINIDDLQYTDNSDTQNIKDILLLFNVITVKEKNSAYSRFPFDSYNKNLWSLEHIHAQNAEGIGNKKELWNAWIDEHIKSFREFSDAKYKEVVSRLESVNRDELTNVRFEELFNEISAMIQDDYGTDLHNIDNMALLNRDTNSSIGNNFFDVKRNMIIKMDREGVFIPVCTRNVFLKYYSSDPSQIHYWSEADRRDYLNTIKRTLRDYLELEEEEYEYE